MLIVYFGWDESGWFRRDGLRVDGPTTAGTERVETLSRGVVSFCFLFYFVGSSSYRFSCCDYPPPDFVALLVSSCVFKPVFPSVLLRYRDLKAESTWKRTERVRPRTSNLICRSNLTFPAARRLHRVQYTRVPDSFTLQRTLSWVIQRPREREILRQVEMSHGEVKGRLLFITARVAAVYRPSRL